MWIFFIIYNNLFNTLLHTSKQSCFSSVILVCC